MTDIQDLSPRIRRIFDEESQKWFFAVVDVVEVLTDSPRARKYWSDMKRKEPELSDICGHFSLVNPKNNRKYQTECSFFIKSSDGKAKKAKGLKG